jgi:hypothetical protein
LEELLLAFSSRMMIAVLGLSQGTIADLRWIIADLREIIASWMIADLQDHRETIADLKETIAEDQEDPNKDSVVL